MRKLKGNNLTYNGGGDPQMLNDKGLKNYSNSNLAQAITTPNTKEQSQHSQHANKDIFSKEQRMV